MQRQSMVLENQSTPVTAASCETPMQWMGSLGRRGTTQCVPDWGRVPLLGLCQGTRRVWGKGAGSFKSERTQRRETGGEFAFLPPAMIEGQARGQAFWGPSFYVKNFGCHAQKAESRI
eukprot:EG_transcript_20787